MNRVKTIEVTKKFVRAKLSGEASGHDWWHTYRVWKIAAMIGKKEKADLFVVELAALFHDISDWKFAAVGSDSAVAGILKKLKIDKNVVDKITAVISAISFKGISRQSRPETLEGRIVQDADRLDALGAIGIARTFTTDAVRGRGLYDPLVPLSQRVKDFGKRDSYSSIHHFYDKVLELKKLMNTKAGKKMAANRHKYVEDYLKEFFAEWEGKR